MPDQLLRVRDLRIRMPGVEAPVTIVDGVDFEIDAGEIVGIAGESGSGKTLSALSLVGLQPPAAAVSGEVQFAGRDLLALSQKELRAVRGGDIGIVFQDPMMSLHPMLTVGRQLTEHMPKHLGIDKREAMRRAEALLADVRLPDAKAALGAFPHQFSGGMRQRIAIALALSCEPKLLIADEPTTALDLTVQAGILRLLDRLRRERGMAVLIVTHDLGVMSSLADRLTMFYAGRVAEAGRTRDLLARPLHPYTEQLQLALPDPENADRPLTPIHGAPATATSRPDGCAFHPRCPYAEDRCGEQVPPLEELSGDRRIACTVRPLGRDQDVGRHERSIRT